MLETNNLYMFGPSTATATSATTATTQPPSSSSTLVNGSPSLSRPHGSTVLEREHHSQQKRPVHYYPQEEDQQPEAEEVEKGYPPSYNNNRFNSSSFGRHHHLEESQPQLNYTYKSNTNHTTKTNPINNRHTTHNHHNQHHHINHHHTPHYLDNHKLNSYSRPTTATTSTNKQPLYPQQQVVKREVSPNILNSPSLIKNSIDVVEEWYDHSVGNKKMLPEVSTTVETGDNKKMKRRKEMNAFIEELNQDFLQNKERIYLEAMNEVNQELKQARQDKHIDYLDGLRDLEYKRQKMIDDGILFKEYQNQVTDNQFRLEIYQAEEEYTAETQEVREKLFNVLEEKRRKLKEDKDNCDLAYDVVLETQNRMHKRNLRKRGPDHAENKSSKKKQLNGPVLVYRLKDDDILSDIQAMRNGLSNTSSSSISSLSSTPLKKSSSINKKK